MAQRRKTEVLKKKKKKKGLRAFWKMRKAGGWSGGGRKTKKMGRKEGKWRGRRKDLDINKRDWEVGEVSGEVWKWENQL